MFRAPDLDDVMALGEALNLDLTQAEGALIKERVSGLMKALNSFYELKVEQDSLLPGYATRDIGHRPTPEEDPLNAYLWKCRIEGRSDGPLSGKTVALKDHIGVAGLPLTLGSHFFDGYIADFDATVVTRLLDSGATIVGKLNLEDFSVSAGLVGVTDFGRVLNPHDRAHVCGGSSSGAGGAVAGHYVDIAIGGDQGGSIRGPSHYCGVVGLKPTHGLVPHTGVVGLDPSIDYIGPMARSVKDVATALQCIAGPDGLDLRQIQVPPSPSYGEFLDLGVDGLRIGVLAEGFENAGLHPEVEAQVMHAVDLLSGAGARVEKVSVPEHEMAWLAFMAIMAESVRLIYNTNLGANASRYCPTSLVAHFGRFKQSSGRQLPPSFKVLLIGAAYAWDKYHGRIWGKARNVVGPLTRAYNEALSRCDVIALPVKPGPAPKYEVPVDYDDALRQSYLGFGPEHIRNTCTFNLTGHPAISVPCPGQGMPVGIQFVARHFDDGTLLRVAAALERCAVPDPVEALS